MTKDLQQHLKNNPQIEAVYVNEDNEWQFHERKGYDKKLTRSEVLKMKVSDQAPVIKEPAAPSNDDLVKTVADLKEKVAFFAEQIAAAEKAKAEKEATDKAAAEKAKAETQKA